MDGYYRGLVEMQIKASKENIILPWQKNKKRPTNRKRRISSVDVPEIAHVLVVGDPGVGKTSYINKKIGKTFNPKYQPTNGIGFYTTPGVVWYDYPGHNQRDMLTVNAPINLVIYMYDVTSKISYNNLNNWKQKIQSKYGDISSIEIGNKMDLASSIKIRGGAFQNSNTK